jgi:LacI family transcriptional regulator
MSEVVTIKDIAKALNLSISTVSRALKGSHKISAATIDMVKQYASDNNYRPNLAAQGLKGKHSRSIGLILSSVPNIFFSEVISGIESIASASDYHVIITQSLESFEKEKLNLEHLTWRSVDGLLVSVSSETKTYDHFLKVQQAGTPIVFFDRIADTINTHQVECDNAGGGYMGTMHLIENGYKRIAHITSPPELSITHKRLEGYKKALGECNIPFEESLVKYCMHGGMHREEVEQVIKELLELNPKPDAIFTASDRITLYTLSILHNLGIKIPCEIAVAGFSNFSAPEIINPSLTVIKQPAFDLGRKSAELLIKLIESKRPPSHYEKIVLPTQWVGGESSGKKMNNQ